eukprot:a174357_3920.p1 GENE.a174357_3920~~a174357_3920.p1  ORF type:complete len:457 (+),score=198.15 a174357_3920:42-1373(+)
MAAVEDMMSEEDATVRQFRIKRLIESLESARGSGTSMISLIIRPGDQIAKINSMLTEEAGTASNIKSRVNRLSVLSAITSCQSKLKLYTKVGPNGLVIFCGTVVAEDGKEKKVSIDVEPFRPINTSLYMCDSRFHVEALRELLQDEHKFGFVVMDGNGSLFGVLSGNHREVLQKITVDLPKKHGRGGQSAVRFARLRVEKRHNYVRKVAELTVQHFIVNDQPCVTGLILAGSADFKNDLAKSDLFDPRLAAIVLKRVDISYGGENGFNQAIELSSDCLANVKFTQEKKLISEYFEQISQETGKFCYGVKDTMQALEMGAVKTLIVWEELSITRYVLLNKTTNESKVVMLNAEQAKDRSHFVDEATSTDLETTDSMPLIEWLAENYKSFGTKLEFVTDRSQEGAQFCKGFGGIGGLLRYRVDFNVMEVDSDGWLSSSDSDEGGI